MPTTLSQDFQAFSVMHGVTLIVCASVIYAVVRRGLTLRQRGGERALTVSLAWVGLIFWFLHQGYYVVFDRDWSMSLPLHVCDLAGLLGPIALLTRWPALRSLLYFWALALTIWGLITPTLSHGPEHVTFWLFWINHASVVLYAVYDCAVGRYRPTLANAVQGCVITLAYIAIVTPLNLANGWNYGYVGQTTLDAKTPLDVLPPWPWRILAIEFMGAALFFHAWLPWGIIAWRKRRRAQRPSF